MCIYITYNFIYITMCIYRKAGECVFFKTSIQFQKISTQKQPTTQHLARWLHWKSHVARWVISSTVPPVTSEARPKTSTAWKKESLTLKTSTCVDYFKGGPQWVRIDTKMKVEPKKTARRFMNIASTSRWKEIKHSTFRTAQHSTQTTSLL